MIAAYCHGFGFRARIFRFVSILGPRYSHGHVFDFVNKLIADPYEIEVLGNGRQQKSYLHVSDCIDGMWQAFESMLDPGRDHEAEKDGADIGIFNLGHEDSCGVDDSLDWIRQRLELEPRRRYTGGERGWVGDSPRVHLDCSRMHGLGWAPRHSIRESVEATVDFLMENRWLLDARS